ncbi:MULTISPECIES: hypothetical protein [Comamonas]|uniref:hypothetical protein n=1 Tax=Comamonas TaxID=283 RepID=UPI0001DA6CD2|nr:MULTISPECIES: hypothetical protein [Comamonas]EFI63643.1 hypothetical protein CTS44_00883 [Comamonas thiooxydans]TFF55236.1 hypothetical protein EIC84_23560 [Comamonas sp. A23]
MKETGLMFKAPLVRDILSDLKTQTRRAFSEHMMKQMRAAAAIGEVSHFLDEGSLQPNDLAYVQQFSPVGQPGDRIYVRETFARVPTVCGSDEVVFAADYQDGSDKAAGVKYTPAIHMPKDLARVWLEITGVRVERLQSISRGDVMAEGCPFPNLADGADPRDWFAEVWKSTGGDWAANPWVWVIDFKRIEKPR